jgi:hypothetical protein
MTDDLSAEPRSVTIRLTEAEGWRVETGVQFLIFEHHKAANERGVYDAQWKEETSVLERTLAHVRERTIEYAADDTTPELVCDHCGQPVVVVGRLYKHLDSHRYGDGTRPTWFACYYMTDGTGHGTNCEVNGLDRVPDEETR